jgi:hypothetical protein
MNPIVRNILAVIASILCGAVVSIGIILLSSSLIPPPAGVDVTDMESIKAYMHLFEPKHFIMPFLDHALGSFVGGLVVALIATSRKMIFALGIGVFHLMGGIMVAFMLPAAPKWFIVLDLVVAYIPMAYLGGKLGAKLSSGSKAASVETEGNEMGNG